MFEGNEQCASIRSSQYLDTSLLPLHLKSTDTPRVALRKLSAYPRQDGLTVGLRELGRIERTLFTSARCARPR